jgi:hypothetical protein
LLMHFWTASLCACSRVGAAHLDGIERWWLQNIEPDPIIVSSSPLPSQS